MLLLSLRQVLAANKKAEEANERRRQEGQRFTLSTDAYGKQATKSSGLKGVSYSLSEAPSATTDATESPGSAASIDAPESPSAPAFNFQEPPTAPQPPKAATPTPETPADPFGSPSAFSTAPIPSAVAPAQPGQQIEDLVGKESDRPFGGLFESGDTSSKLQAVPEDAAKKAKVSKIELPSCHDIVLGVCPVTDRNNLTVMTLPGCGIKACYLQDLRGTLESLDSSNESACNVLQLCNLCLIAHGNRPVTLPSGFSMPLSGLTI